MSDLQEKIIDQSPAAQQTEVDLSAFDKLMQGQAAEVEGAPKEVDLSAFDSLMGAPAAEVQTTEAPAPEASNFGIWDNSGFARGMYAGTKEFLGSAGIALKEGALKVNDAFRWMNDAVINSDSFKSWIDEEDARIREDLSDVKEYKDHVPEMQGGVGEFFGQLIPQTALFATAILSKNPTLANIATTGMGFSSFGSGMDTYETYKQEKGEEVDELEKWGAGLAYALAEFVPERAGLGILMPKSVRSKIARKVLGENIEQISKTGKEMLEDLMLANPTKTKQLLGNIAKGSAVEGGQEMVTELANMATDRYLTGMDISAAEFGERLAMAGAGGAAMGGMLGPFSAHAQRSMDKARREKAGAVSVAQDDMGNVWEIVETQDGRVVGFSPSGKVNHKLDPEIKDKAVTVDLETFNTLTQQVREGGQLSDEMIREQQHRQIRQQVAQSLNVLGHEDGRLHVWTDKKEMDELTGQPKEYFVIREDGTGMAFLTDRQGNQRIESAKDIEATKEIYTEQQIFDEMRTRFDEANPIEPPADPQRPEEFNLNGKNYKVTNMTPEGLIIGAEMDENGATTGEVIQLTPEEQQMVMDDMMKDPTSKPETRVIQAGGQDYKLNPAEDGSYTVEGIASQEEAAAAAQNIEASLGEKLNVEVVKVDSGDTFTPDTFTVKLVPTTPETKSQKSYAMAGQEVTRDDAASLIDAAETMDDLAELDFSSDPELTEIAAQKFQPAYSFKGKPVSKTMAQIMVDKGMDVEITNDPEMQAKLEPREELGKKEEVTEKPVAEEVTVREKAEEGKTYMPQEVEQELTIDEDGNVTFVHYSTSKFDTLDPAKSVGQPSRDSSPEELAAKASVGGVSDLYTHPDQKETARGENEHILKVPKHKVYHLQSDPLNFYEEAQRQFKEKYPDRAFGPNYQGAWISKVANENGFDVLVTDWKQGPIAKLTKPMAVTEGTGQEFGERQRQEVAPGVRVEIGGEAWTITEVDDKWVSMENDSGSRTIPAARADQMISRYLPKKQDAPANTKNEAAKTQEFFGDVVEGKSDKFKPSKPWVPVLKMNKAQEAFNKTFERFRGFFDEHIATSIPAFRDVQIKVGSAIANMYKDQGGLVYDLGGSEGGFVKAITESTGGKVKSINLDPSPKMEKAHNASPVEGSEFVKEAFHEGFEDGGEEFKAHKPKQKADVVHESMMFQFITPERAAYVAEIAGDYLKDDGLFITEEKYKLDDAAQQKANEDKKNKDYKTRFYTEAQINEKAEEVLVGMHENQANYEAYKAELGKHFKYVSEYWDGGNFKGVVATNSKAKHDQFLKEVGSTETEFSETQIAKPESRQKETVAEAEKQVDTQPTEAQKEAGNYKKGHTRIRGLDIAIENPAGSTRSGVDGKGKAWSTKMKNTYGYFKGTKGKDGDQIDFFLGPNPEGGKIFVVDQIDPATGKFDEHKVMFGFDSRQEAMAAYQNNYEKGWKGMGAVTEVSEKAFKDWLNIEKTNKKNKRLPVSFLGLNRVKYPTNPAGMTRLQFAQQAKAAIERSLSAIAPNTEVMLAETKEDFANAVKNLPGAHQNDKGMLLTYKDGRRVILINVPRMSTTTAAHELSHVVFAELLNASPLHFNAFKEDVANALRSREAQELLDFVSVYNKVDQGEEFFSELTAMMTDKNVPRSTVQAIKEVINKWFERMFGFKPLVKAAKAKDILDFFQNLGEQIRTGSVITEATIDTRRLGLNKVAGYQMDKSQDLSVKRQANVIRNREETLEDYGLKGKKRYNVREIGEALQKRTRKEYVKIPMDKRTPQAKSRIADYMVDELVFELATKDAKSAVGWYTTKYQSALDILAETIPALKEQDNRDVFTMFLAVTSDGQKVQKNFELAVKAFKMYEKDGKVDVDKFTEGGDRNASIKRNLGRINKLVEGRNIQELKAELLEEKTVGELRKADKDFKSNYMVTETVPRAAGIFGEKLGAFYANLSGSTGYLTMDRWWSRTFNRYRGQLLPEIPGSAKAPVDTKGRKIGLARFKEMIGKPDMTDRKALGEASKLAKQYADKGFKNGTPQEKAANTIYKAAYVALNDIPKNSSDRSFMIETSKLARERLNEKFGYDVTLADLQAILWYYEKRLYGELSGVQPLDVSYEDAAKRAAEGVKSKEQAAETDSPNPYTIIPDGNVETVADNLANMVGAQETTTEEIESIKKQIFGVKGARRIGAKKYLQMAKAMEKEGKSPREIKYATSMERGADGEWKFEVPDIINPKGEYISYDIKDRMIDKKNTLGNVVDAPLLFDAYPALKKIKIRFAKMAALAAYSPKEKAIKVSTRLFGEEAEIKSSLIHEIQHAIQEQEGFARGGSPTLFADLQTVKDTKAIADELSKAVGLKDSGIWVYETSSLGDIVKKSDLPPALKKWAVRVAEAGPDMVMDFIESTPLEQYKRLAGEVEARNVQTREGMTDEQRAETLLEETEDYAREAQVVKFQKGVKRQADWFSPTRRALGKINQKKGTPEQFKSMLVKQGGKPAEIEWMGFDEAFEGKKSITKEEVQEWLNQNEVEINEVTKTEEEGDWREITEVVQENAERYTVYFEDGASVGVDATSDDEAMDLARDERNREGEPENQTRYGDYVLEGGDNYQELLLTMPASTKERDEHRSFVESMQEKYGTTHPIELHDLMTLDEKEELRRLNRFMSVAPSNYASSHWEEKNILAHIRFNERYAKPRQNKGRDAKLAELKFDDFLELTESDTHYKVRNKLTGVEYAAGYSKQVMKGTNLTVEGLKEYLMDPSRELITGHPKYAEANRKFEKPEKVLFLEEVQSDWAQEGREEGFRQEVKPTMTQEQYEAEEKAIEEEAKRLGLEMANIPMLEKLGTPEAEALIERIDKNTEEFLAQEGDYFKGKTPDMPYKKTDQWVNLALRRMIRHAAENGFDRIAWTTGEQQAERYELSNTVNSIERHKETADNKEKGEIDISIELKETGGLIGLEVNKTTGVITGQTGSTTLDDVEGKKLDSVIGKEMADKVLGLEDGDTTLEGEDLKIGGEGMKTFYDKMLPKAAAKLGKKYGAKPEIISLETGEAQMSLPIPQKMKDAAMIEGTAKFQKTTKPDEKQVRGFNDSVREVFQDNMLSVKNWQDSLIREGIKVRDFENAYMKENLSHGRILNKMEKFTAGTGKRLIKAVSDFVKAGDMTLQEAQQYVIAKHGPERNRTFWDKGRAKPGEDVSGLSELRDVVVANTTNPAEALLLESMPINEFADYYAKTIEDKVGQEQTDKLKKAVNEATDFALKELRDSGIISKEQYDELSSRWSYYVPLRGWSETDDTFDYASQFGRKSNPVKKAGGRKSLADDPFAYILNAANTAVIAAERNRIAQATGNLVRNNKVAMQDFAEFKTIYFVKAKEKDAQGGDIWYETDHMPDKEAWDEGRVKRDVQTDYKARKSDAQAKEHEVEFFENGQKMVLILKDPAVARALQGVRGTDWTTYANSFVNSPLLKLDVNGKSRTIIGAPAAATRYLSSVMTSMNPAFVLPNMARDIPLAILSEFVHGTTKDAMTMIPNLRKAEGAIRRSLAGKPKRGNRIDQLYEQFLASGAATGFVHQRDVDYFRKELEKDLRDANRTMNPVYMASRGMRAGVSAVEKLSEWSENITRFAVYLNHIDKGASSEQAATEAKNASVNFNRKGRLSPAINGLFAFFNAGVQAGDKYFKMWGANWPKMAAAHSFLAVQGFLSAMMMDLFGGDDEEGEKNYDKLSPYTRHNYLTVPVVGTDKVATIPMPHVFRAFHGIGVSAYDMMTNRIGVEEAIKETLGSIPSDIIPVDGSGMFNRQGDLSPKPLLPTFAKPLYEIAVNENFMGGRISPEPYTPKQRDMIADTKSAKSNVNSIAQATTDLLYKLGGGDETGFRYVEKDGELKQVPNLLDVSPHTLEHLVNSYLGGTGKFVGNVYKTTESILGGAANMYQGDDFKEAFREVELNSVPVVRRFARTPSGDPMKGKYFDTMREVSRWKTLLDHYEDQMTPEGVTKYLELWDQVGMPISSFESQYDVIDMVEEAINMAKETDDKSGLNEFEKQKREAMRGAIEAWEDRE